MFNHDRPKKIYYFLLCISIFKFNGALSVDQRKKQVSFGLGGDVMIGRNVGKTLSKKGIMYPWGNLLTNLRSTSFNLVNLESPLTKSTKKSSEPKVFNFQSDPKNIDCLLKANIQVVNLANNHSLDFDEAGLQETLNSLDKNNIYHVGAGMNIDQAKKPVLFTKNGFRFAILGFTNNEPREVATMTKAGNNYIEINQKTCESLKELIQNIKKNVDILIISIHWGPNWQEKPSKEFINFAHALIDTGADIIHGHSSHIFQGIELYKNKLIFYSCGDLLDDYKVEKLLRNDETFLFIVSVDEQGIEKLQLIPAIISNEQVNQVEGADAQRLLKKMQKLSNELGTLTIDDQGLWQR